MGRIVALRRFSMIWNLVVTLGLVGACVWLVMKTGSVGAAWEEAERLLPLNSVMTWVICIGVAVPAMVADGYARRLEGQLKKAEEEMNR